MTGFQILGHLNLWTLITEVTLEQSVIKQLRFVKLSPLKD